MMHGPLQIERQGHFWVGVQRTWRNGLTYAHKAMSVQFQIPAAGRRHHSLVMVHGGGGQGLDFVSTPDGRPGWAEYFLRRGYDVYIVDRPGMGRSPHDPLLDKPFAPSPSYEQMSAMMYAPARHPNTYPQAKLHTQWPPGGEEVVDQFMAGMGPLPGSLAEAQADMQRCGVALLERIGPATLLTTSMGAPFGWLTADRRPDLVQAIVAVEPISPPFFELPGLGGLGWGVTAVPITYEPPISDPSELLLEPRPSGHPDLIECLVQREPARQLPNLRRCPVAVVTGEASWMAQHNHGLVEYLAQAGVPAEHLRLEQHGVHGNGHMLMCERNSDESAAIIASWLDSVLSRH